MHTHVPNSWVPYIEWFPRVVSFYELSPLKLAALASDCFSYNKLQNRKNKRKPWWLFVLTVLNNLAHVCSNPIVVSRREMCLVEENAIASLIHRPHHLLFSSPLLYTSCMTSTQLQSTYTNRYDDTTTRWRVYDSQCIGLLINIMITNSTNWAHPQFA